MAGNYKTYGPQIDSDFTNLMYSNYLSDLWGIEVGYRTKPAAQVMMKKWLLDWQAASDCGEQCTESHNQPLTVVSMCAITQPDPCSIYRSMNANYKQGCCDKRLHRLFGDYGCGYHWRFW